jgi:hypothetical protein
MPRSLVWVDTRGDDGQGQALVLLLGNSGPSIARNVKVIFDPAPPSTLDIKPILEILKQGIASLAPGRTMQWALGAAHNTTDWDAHKTHRVRIEAEGPFGAIEPLEYVMAATSTMARPERRHNQKSTPATTRAMIAISMWRPYHQSYQRRKRSDWRRASSA